MLSSSPNPPIVSRSPSPAKDELEDTGLSWVEGTLDILRDTMEIATDVPYVSGVAAVAIKIFEVLDSVRTNKEACEHLARSVAEISTAIAKRAKEPDGKAFAEDLQGDLVEFQHTLDRVFSFVVEQTQTHFGPRALFNKQIRERTMELEKDLKSAYRAFVIESLMALREKMAGPPESSEPVLEPPVLVQAAFRLPSAPKVFFGREQMLGDLCSAVMAGRWIPIIGGGGAGKTTLSLALLHHPEVVQHFGERRYFVLCEEARDCGALIRSIALQLGLSGPFSIEHLRELVRSSLAEHPPTLLCLDSLESSVADKVNEVEDFLEDLEAIDGLMLMVTMRTYTLPAPRIRTWFEPYPRLGSLDPESALSTFIAISGKGEGDEQLTLLLKELDYIPLAVTIMAVLARQGAEPSELYDQWRSRSTEAVTRGEEHRLQSLNASIRLSIDSLPMKRCPEALHLLSGMSILPNGVLRGKLPSLVPEGFDHVKAVAVLQQVGLAERTTTEEVLYDLHLHSIIREFMKSYHPPDQEALTALYKGYMKMADGGNFRGGAFTVALETARPEMRNMRTVFGSLLQSYPPSKTTSVAELEELRRSLVGLDFLQRTLRLDTSSTQDALRQLPKPSLKHWWSGQGKKA